MDMNHLPTDMDALRQLIAGQQSQLKKQASELALKDKLVEQQAHSILELKASSDKLDQQVIELELKLEKQLKQLQQDMFAGSGWTPSRSTLANLELAVEFALQPLAAYLRGYLKTDRCIGGDDTSVLLITPKVLPDLTTHPRAERIAEVLTHAIETGKPSISAKFWGSDR